MRSSASLRCGPQYAANSAVVHLEVASRARIRSMRFESAAVLKLPTDEVGWCLSFEAWVPEHD